MRRRRAAAPSQVGVDEVREPSLAILRREAPVGEGTRPSEEVEGPRGVIVRPQPPKPNDDRDMQDFLFLLNQILGRDR